MIRLFIRFYLFSLLCITEVPLMCAAEQAQDLNTFAPLAAKPVLSWQFTGQGPMGAPVVQNNLVYAGNGTRSDTNSGKNYFYALDAKTGKMQWAFSTKGNLAKTPLLGKGIIFIISEEYGANSEMMVVLYSLDAKNGKERWHRTLGTLLIDEIQWNKDGTIAAVTATQKTEWFMYQDITKWTIDPNSGQVLRKKSFEKVQPKKLGAKPISAHSMALQEDSDVIYSRDSGVFVAFQKNKGEALWQFVHPLREQLSKEAQSQPAPPWFYSPIFKADLVFLGGNFPEIYALDVKTGKTVWKAGIGGWTAKPLFAAGNVLLCSDGDKSAYALEQETGKFLWKITEDERTTGPDEKGIISHGFSGAAVDENGLYLSSGNEILYGYRF